MRKMTAGLLSADVAGELHRVGISSLRYDGQTVIGSPDIGVCIKGGFRNLARALARAGGFIEPVGSGARDSLFLTQLKGIGYDDDKGLELFLHDRKDGFKKQGEQVISPLSVDAAFIGLPVTAVKRLSYFVEGKEQGVLSQQFPAEMQRALSMIEPGHVVKISVLLDRPLIEDSPICHITVAPESGSPINCSEVRCLPAPSRAEFPKTPEHGKQVVLLYLAGEQALDLRRFMLRERDLRRDRIGAGSRKEERSGLSNILRVEITRFLASHLGVDPQSILGTRTSMWSGERSEPYTYIRADNQSSSFNPRAQFGQQAMPGVWIGGAEFSLRSTLVGGALESGVRHARNIVVGISQASDSLAVELSKSS